MVWNRNNAGKEEEAGNGWRGKGEGRDKDGEGGVEKEVKGRGKQEEKGARIGDEKITLRYAAISLHNKTPTASHSAVVT